MKVKSESKDYLDAAISNPLRSMVCQDGADCHRRDGETKFGCSSSGIGCGINITTESGESTDLITALGKDVKFTCTGENAYCAGAQVDPGGAVLEFLDLNIDTKASLPHSNYLSRICIAKHKS